MAGRPKSILRPGIAGAAAVLAALPFLHCASVPKASVERDIEAKTSPLPEGFGRLYVYRASGWSLFRSLSDIYVDENFLGTIEN